MNFLYWNLNKKPVEDLVVELAHEHDVDIIILSECELRIPDLQVKLNSPVKWKYGLPYGPLSEPVFLIRLPRESLKIVEDSMGVSIRRLMPPMGIEIIIIAVHLPSKLFAEGDDQILFSTRLARKIETVEEKIGHRRTIIVGDLNMNPFEVGVVGAEGLHAVMVRSIAEKKSRIVGGEERHFFYNPMWSHFGEFPYAPAGTYFYDRSQQVNYYWNMFDQVMVRPDLLEHFEDESVRILTSTGSTDLLTASGRPDTKVGSDHLPILFNLQLMKGV